MAEHNNETRNGTSAPDGASDGTSSERKPNPFAKRTDYAPDAFVGVKIKFALRERFNAWYASQYPGVTSLPARDEWVNRVFERGLVQTEKMMPAQLSPEERWAKALEDAS